jgi:hypothetical protein
MEKTTKKYSELDDIHRLKISKVFIYQKLDKSKKKECSIVFEGTKMKYLFVDEQMIDL